MHEEQTEVEGSGPSPEELEQKAETEDQSGEEGQAPAEENAARHNKVPAGKRIRQLTRKWRDTERENEALKARLDALEKRVPVTEPQRPQRDDFDTDEAYEDELFQYWESKKQNQKPSDPKPQPVDEDRAKMVDDFEDSLERLGEDAWSAVMENDWPTTPDISDYILNSDKSAQLAYHLATNADQAERLTKLTPLQALRQLEKIEAGLEDQPLPKTDDADQSIPAPPLTTTKPTGAVVTDQDKMSTQQWVEARRAGKI